MGVLVACQRIHGHNVNASCSSPLHALYRVTVVPHRANTSTRIIVASSSRCSYPYLYFCTVGELAAHGLDGQQTTRLVVRLCIRMAFRPREKPLRTHSDGHTLPVVHSKGLLRHYDKIVGYEKSNKGRRETAKQPRLGPGRHSVTDLETFWLRMAAVLLLRKCPLSCFGARCPPRVWRA